MEAAMVVELNGIFNRIEDRLDKIENKIDIVRENVAKMEERINSYTDKLSNTDKNICEIQKTVSELQIHHESQRIIDQKEDKKRDKFRTLFMLFTAVAAIGSLVITLVKL
jgi:predicted  nucleic acid-binding Zn-ribbon protein